MKGAPNVARVLEGPVPDWKFFGKGNTGNGAPGTTYGFPRFREAAFLGRFPFATIDLKDEALPLDVTLTGGLEREVKVNLDPDRLRYYGLEVKDVIDTIKDENLTTPGGTMELGSYKYLVRIPGEFKATSLIEDLVIKVKGAL